jgi:hypothetical protein
MAGGRDALDGAGAKQGDPETAFRIDRQAVGTSFDANRRARLGASRCI